MEGPLADAAWQIEIAQRERYNPVPTFPPRRTKVKTYVIFGRYYATQAEAKSAAKENGIKFDPETDTVEVPTQKDELIDYLNRLVVAQAPQEQTLYSEPTAVRDINDDIAPQSHADRLVEIDELVAAASLPQRLTWAALALEDARTQIVGPQGVAAAADRSWKRSAPVEDDVDPFA